MDGKDDGVPLKFGQAPAGCSLGRDGENNCPTCWQNAVTMKADNKSDSVNRSQRLIFILIQLNS